MKMAEKMLFLLFLIFGLIVAVADRIPLWKALVTVTLPLLLSYVFIMRFDFLLGFILGLISWNILVLITSIATGSLTPEILKIAKLYLLLWILPLSGIYAMLRIKHSKVEIMRGESR